ATRAVHAFDLSRIGDAERSAARQERIELRHEVRRGQQATRRGPCERIKIALWRARVLHDLDSAQVGLLVTHDMELRAQLLHRGAELVARRFELVVASVDVARPNIEALRYEIGRRRAFAPGLPRLA